MIVVLSFLRAAVKLIPIGGHDQICADGQTAKLDIVFHAAKSE